MLIGVDIIEIDRIRKTMEKWNDKFLCKVFTPGEMRDCERRGSRPQHYAGKFAAKEAVIKAVKSWINTWIQWKEIEILNDKNGKPVVNLNGRLKDLLKEKRVMVSISHSIEMAVAFAVISDNMEEEPLKK